MHSTRSRYHLRKPRRRRGRTEEIQRSVPPLSESRPELYARLERARHEVATQDLAKHYEAEYWNRHPALAVPIC